MNVQNQEKFIVITASKGMVITSYKENDDIKEYTSFTIAYTPLNADLSIYREITVEEDAAHMEAMEKAVEEEIKNARA